jgi:[acyl-carrier-protein] S-malonyltransferase
MKVYLFPGQGAQFVGMGNVLLEKYPNAAKTLQEADEILGFSIAEKMKNGTEEELKQTDITQPAIFLYSVIVVQSLGGQFLPQAVAGHSLGEFSALVAAKSLDFADGLQLVYKRACAMQKACIGKSAGMAAVLGLSDELVAEICAKIDGIVVPANYNCPGQLVISGEDEALKKASEALKEAGAKRVLPLTVGGAFHSPLMQSAQDELAKAIHAVELKNPICPIYQNVHAQAETEASIIKENLIAQLTAPVKWTQTGENLYKDGFCEAIEVGPGSVLQGLMKKINKDFILSVV